MKRCFLFLFAVCIFFSNPGLAANPVRVAVIPPATDFGPRAVEESAAMADYVQMKLHGLPDVEWVERGDLNRLFGEAKFKLLGDRGVSGVALGRLLKADVIISGDEEDPSWKSQDGTRRYTSILHLQIIDLTNASVLTEDSVELFTGLDTDRIRADNFERVANAAQRLMAAALNERRANSAAILLAPIFFANSGASLRLEHWEEKWQDALREEALARPGVRLLHFLGVEQARQEQTLARLGFTEADPAAWQNAADGYVWGGYQEVPVATTMAFEDTGVEAELFLRMGQGEPRRFTRRFAVKDFPDASRALAREILQAAHEHGKTPRVPAEAGVSVARSIFARLCALIHGGFFSDDPKLADLVPYDATMGSAGEKILTPIEHPPFAKQRLEYSDRMLQLACFFDPENDRLQIMRWTVAARLKTPLDAPLNIKLDRMEECFALCERQVRARNFDAVLFATAADAVMRMYVFPMYLNGIKEQRTALLGTLIPLLAEKLPTLSQHLDEMKVPAYQRSFLASWLRVILESDLAPALRLQYLAAARPVTPDSADLSQLYERLMTDLGDRKQVQTALMQPALPKAPPAPPQTRPVFPTAGPAPVAGTSAPLASRFSPPPLESWLAGITVSNAPPMRRIELPLHYLLLLTSSGKPTPARARQQAALAAPSYPVGKAGGSVRQIDGYGDQLVLDLTLPSIPNTLAVRTVSPALLNGGPLRVLYQASTATSTVFEGADSDPVCGPEGRVVYRKGDNFAWTDLVSSASGIFTPEEGTPAAPSATLGFDGAGQVVAADGQAKTVGLFNWGQHRWLALPPPPPLATPTPLPNGTIPSFGRVLPARVLAGSNAIIFPLRNLLFDRVTQKWRSLPSEACQPSVAPTPPGPPQEPIFRTPEYAAKDCTCIDDHLWSWNAGGINDFSLKENRVVWHGDSSRVICACADGPYFWLALGFQPHQGPILVLMDRATHNVLGAVASSMLLDTIHADDHHLWIGLGERMSTPADSGGSGPLLCVDKTALYAAINRVPPAVMALPPRPAALEANGSDLYAAVLRHDAAAVRRLLDAGAPVDQSFGPGQATALMVAAWTGDVAICQLLIARGADVNAARTGDEGNWTALAAAASRGDTALVNLLLQSKARATETALLAAVRGAYLDAIATLCKAGAPVEKLGEMITADNDPKLAQLVLASSLPLSQENRTQLSVLARVPETSPAVGTDPRRASDIIGQALKQKTADEAVKLTATLTTDQVNSPQIRRVFMNAIRTGSADAVEAFLIHGLSPALTQNERIPGSETPLMAAAGHPEIFLSLLQHGADPHAAELTRDTLVERVAASPGAAAILPTLLKSYPALSSPDGYGTFGGTLLCAAAGRRQFTHSDSLRPSTDVIQAVQWLVDHGVAPGACGREGYSALHAAFADRSASAASLLAGLGADIDARDLAARTVFDAPYLLTGGPRGLIEELRAYRPDSDLTTRGRQRLLDAIDARERYPELFQAVSDNNLGRVQELLKQGVGVLPPFIERFANPDPFVQRAGLVFLALKNGSREMVDALLAHRGNPNIGEAGCTYYGQYNVSLFNGTLQPVGSYDQPVPTGRCKTPLIEAAESGNRAMVDLLLDHGAYAPATDQGQRNAVDAAATPELAAHISQRTRPQFEARKLVLVLTPAGEFTDERKKEVQHIIAEAPEAVFAADANGDSPLALLTRSLGGAPSWESEMHNLPVNGKADEVLAQFHQAGIRIDSLDRFGVTALHRAVLYTLADSAAKLVKIGFDPLFPDRRGITPLDLAGRIADPTQRAAMLDALRGAPTPGPTPRNR